MAEKFIPIKEALTSAKESKKVAVRGWVYRKRELKEKIFLVVRDSSGIIQAVFPSTDKQAEKVTIESSVQISGTLKKDERAPGGFEIAGEKLEIVGLAEIYPIGKDLSDEFLLDVRHLWLRSRKLTAILKIRHTAVGAIHEFFRSRGYYEFDPPILTPTACEGALTLFQVKYFDEIMYLTQSWQLYAEAGIFALEKIP